MDLHKNQIVELHITSMTAQGSGVGRTETGIAVFVPQSAVGDGLLVKIVKLKKSYAFGIIDRIISPSKNRVTADCPSFSKCGGCVYRHISYESEKQIKEQKVKDAVSRIGLIDADRVRPLLCANKRERYRNKAQYPVGLDKNGRVVAGFFAPHSHRIIPCGDCLLQPEVFGKITKIICDFMDETKQLPYNEETGRGKLRHIYIRTGEITGEIMVCLVVNGNGLKQEPILVERLTSEVSQIKSIVINSNREKTNVILGEKNRVAYGREYITDMLCGLKFKISPHSFYQVNRETAELLYKKARDYACVQSGAAVLDLYCGTGTIGLSMAQNCKRLVGIEIVPQAIEDARENAVYNGIENAEFICADALDGAEELQRQGITPDAVIVDPPRKGLDPGVIETIVKMNPKRVVYVSCDPATLSRDLRAFEESGYVTEEITPVDMFPGTCHVESVALIKKYGDV